MNEWLTNLSRLPKIAKVVLGASMLNSMGIGLALPIGMLFVHDVLGVPVAEASLLVPITAAASLVGHTVAGQFADRLGTVWGSLAPTIVGIVGACLYATASGFWMAVLAAAVTGVGNGAQTGWFSLLTRVTPVSSRSFAYGVNQVGANAGIGVGLLISGAVSSVGVEQLYRYLFLGKAGLQLLLVLILWRLVKVIGPNERLLKNHDEDPNLSRRPWPIGFVILLAVLNFVMIAFGVSQLESAVIAGIISTPDMPSYLVSISMLINTIVVVAINFMVGAKISKVRPTVLFILTGPLWGLCWLLCAAALAMQGTEGVVIFCVAMIVFAIGEVFTAIALPTLISEFSKSTSIGRNFGFQNSINSLAFLIGPLATSALLVSAQAAVAFVVFAVSVQVLTVVGIVLDRQLRRVRNTYSPTGN